MNDIFNPLTGQVEDEAAAGGGGITASSVDTLTNKTLNDLTNYIDADAVHQVFYNNSGGTLTAGTAVVNTQWNATNSATEVIKARSDSLTTCPCHGLVEATTLNNAIGSLRTHGILTGIDTSAWSEGADLWLSPVTAGVMTTTMPTTAGQYQQFIGTVVKQNATTGIIAVNVGAPHLIVVAGGAATITQLEIDFGVTPISDMIFTITDAGITGTSKIIATVAYEDTTDNTADEASELLVVAGKPVAGSCSLLAYSDTALLKGKYKINYMIG